MINHQLELIQKRKTNHHLELIIQEVPINMAAVAPQLPVEFRNKIAEKALAEGGSLDGDEFLIIRKRLFRSDVNENQNRLVVPINARNQNLLSDEELESLKDRRYCMKVDMIEESGEVERVYFGIWKVGRSVSCYVLTTNWKKVVAHNQLKESDAVQLWGVRISGKLCFCLVKE